MKKRISAFLLAVVMVLGTVAAAAGMEKSITVTPMSMTINGQAVTPLKSNGDAAEVFAYDGATYVPLRYLSELLGITVEWDKNDPNTAKLVSDKITLSSGGKDGTYTGTASGFGGTVTAIITVLGGKITACTLTGDKETPAIGGAALSQLEQQVMIAGNADIDGVTGASVTSAGVKEAVQSAIAAAGGVTGNVGSANEKKEAVDEYVDVVVVGGGGSGMTTAVKLVEKGKKVILVEKRSLLGGTTALAATYFSMVNSPLQQEAGMGMGIPEFVAGQKKTDPRLSTENYTDLLERAEGSRQWLLSLGVDLTRPMSHYQVGLSDGGSLGSALVMGLTKAVGQADLDYRVNTKATELVQENGKITGVKVESPNGPYTIHAKAVVLATGGYAANQEMVARFAPEWAGAPTTTAVGSTGDGALMAEAVGASLTNMDNVWLNPAIYVGEDGTICSLSAVRAEGGIMVNVDGMRFCDDYEPNYSIMSKKILEQKGGYVYIMVDQAAVDRSARVSSFVEQGYLMKADTLEELAGKMEVPVDALQETVKRYQGFVDKKEDSDFGRTLNMSCRFDTAPYYAAAIRPGIQVTLGGIAVDDDMQAVDTTGKPIDGLFAICECADDRMYGAGMTTIAVTFGTRLAEHLANTL